MAKIMKDTRETIDVNTELENIKNETKKRKQTKEVNKNTKAKDAKKNTKSKKNTKKAPKKNFLGEVRSEMAKVKWPSKKDMVKYSIATIVFVIFFALFFYAIDMVIALLKEVS